MTDVHYALRTLRRTPLLTTAAVLCLAIGIGANTTIFTAANALVLHPVPTARSEGLVMLSETRPRRPDDPDFDRIAPANLLDWQRQSRTLERAAAFNWWDVNLTGIEEPERVTGFRVTPEFFRVLGERPALGRDFAGEEGEPGVAGVVILSHPLWTRRFGADSAVIGQAVLLNGVTHTIVGVMSADFIFPPGAELWAPRALRGEIALERDARFLRAIGRLRNGATLDAARAEASAIASRLAAQYPDMNAGWGMRVEPADAFYGRHPRPYLLVLLGAVGFVLLIACANVANLLLARATGRSRELAVRVALGATRARLVRQLFLESAVVSLLGGAAGTLLALWGVLLFRSSLPGELMRFNPGWTRITVDVRALAFTLAVSALTALLVGVVPALVASRADPQHALKESARGASAGAVRMRMRSVLVVAEVALALVLLVGTGLMLRSFIGLMRADQGYRADHVLSMQVSPPPTNFDTDAKLLAVYRNLLDRLGELPGVRDAAVSSLLPPDWNDYRTGVVLEGQPTPRRGDPVVEMRLQIVSPSYMEVMQIPLLRGRGLTQFDVEGSPQVAVIGEGVARRLWPNQAPIGKRLTFLADSVLTTVVGVVADVRNNPNIGDDPLSPVIYVPFGQWPWRTMNVVVRTESEPAAAAPAIRRAIAALDPSLAPGDMHPLERVLFGSLSPQRVTAQMLAVFAGIATLLAVVGIYGVMSYAVTQRTHEIGVRIALGARGADVLRHVLRQASVLVLIGLVLGLGGAFAMSRGLTTLLYEVAPTDPGTYLAVTVLLAVTALLGAWLPARRASRVDPMVALRAE
ncbi:MAG: ABC transporter permease [Gemmatimonadaceae bacterium]